MSDDRADRRPSHLGESDVLWQWQAAFEDHLHSYVDGLDLSRSLQDAIAYALLGGGKRLRPLLTIGSCVAVGSTAETAMTPAVAIELIHAFSLVHDDLPAMDDDDIRRGRPSLHIAFGEAMAILAGDAMVPLAFSALSGYEHPPTTVHAMTTVLADATTLMIRGQVLDTLGDASSRQDDAHLVEEIHAAKTGALIEAACTLGGLAGGGDASQLAALANFGASLGLMFQDTDDLLDAVGDPEIVGKATGKDESMGKMTVTSVHGVDRATEMIAAWHGDAENALEPLGSTAQELRNLTRIMASRSA